MSGDKRTVTTDALETLGFIITPSEKRDAIHLAVEPVVAGQQLTPGTHVQLIQGRAYAALLSNGVGIVDPFLLKPVQPNEMFWLVVYPRQIKSLRHVWEHDAFPPSELGLQNPVEVGVRISANVAAQQRLAAFAASMDMSYSGMIKAMTAYVEEDERLYGGDNVLNGQSHWFDHPGLWDDYVLVTGKPKPKDGDGYFLSCAC